MHAVMAWWWPGGVWGPAAYIRLIAGGGAPANLELPPEQLFARVCHRAEHTCCAVPRRAVLRRAAAVFEPRFLAMFEQVQAQQVQQQLQHQAGVGGGPDGYDGPAAARFGHVLSPNLAPPALMEQAVGGFPPVGPRPGFVGAYLRRLCVAVLPVPSLKCCRARRCGHEDAQVGPVGFYEQHLRACAKEGERCARVRRSKMGRYTSHNYEAAVSDHSLGGRAKRVNRFNVLHCSPDVVCVVVGMLTWDGVLELRRWPCWRTSGALRGRTTGRWWWSTRERGG